MKKCAFLIPIFLIISIFIPTYSEALTFNPPINIYSEGVYMINLNEDEVVFQKNQDEQMHPASLTKIMTAVLVLEHFKDNPEEMANVKVSAPSSAYNDFAGVNVSTADIRANEEVSYRDLLYALLLPSACEAGNIIAYNLGDGDIQSFVVKMNEKAQELGMTNTHYVNAHGLHDETQVSTPKDIATLVQYAMTFPDFMEISSAPSYTLPATSTHPNGTYLRHTNAMLHSTSSYYYEYASGIKTGTLDEAGRCLVSTASKDGMDYLTVTLGAPMYDENGKSKFYNCIDQKALYEWAYSNLTYQELLSEKTEIANVKVEYGKDTNTVNVRPAEAFKSIWLKDKSDKSIEQKVYMNDNIIAPISEGQVLGKLELEYNGEVIFTTDLVSTQEVKRNTVVYKATVAKQFFSSKMIKIALAICLGLILLYTLIFVLKGRRPRRTRRKQAKRKFKR